MVILQYFLSYLIYKTQEDLIILPGLSQYNNQLKVRCNRNFYAILLELIPKYCAKMIPFHFQYSLFSSRFLFRILRPLFFIQWYQTIYCVDLRLFNEVLLLFLLLHTYRDFLQQNRCIILDILSHDRIYCRVLLKALKISIEHHEILHILTLFILLIFWILKWLNPDNSILLNQIINTNYLKFPD